MRRTRRDDALRRASERKAELLERISAASEPEAPETHIDYDRLAGAVLARQARERETAERASQRRDREAERGGPCLYCGVEFSPERQPDGVVSPHWYEVNGGVCCAWCQKERDSGGVPRVDSEHRAVVLHRLLGPEVIGHWVMPYLLDRAEFRWWHEIPGARPGGRLRFTYLDREALAARLRPAEAAPLRAGDPCPRCGCAYMWMLVPAQPGGHEVDTHVPMYPFTSEASTFKIKYPATPEHLRCTGCASYDDFHRVIERLCGVTWGEAKRAADDLGLDWYAQLPDGDPRRELTLAPFAYLGDLRTRLSGVRA